MENLKKKQVQKLINELTELCGDFIFDDEIDLSQDDKVSVLLQVLIVQTGFMHRKANVLSNQFLDKDGYNYILAVLEPENEEEVNNGTVH